MTRGILIIGNSSALSAAVAAEAGKRVEHFAAAFIPNRLQPTLESVSTSIQPSMDAQIVLNWNPGSPVSARTLLLAAENRLERIDDAILVCAPPSIHKRPTELAPADVEILVSDHIKGWFFLVKELVSVFKAKKAGNLALVLSEFDTKRGLLFDANKNGPDFVGLTIAASFRAFTQAMLDSASGEVFKIMCFSGP
jgi:NAD(P)-dependent dehydrogenase (short-subunit alcohol dehydrogenase family)